MSKTQCQHPVSADIAFHLGVCGLGMLQGGGYRREACDDPKAGFSYALDVQRGELVCRLKKTNTYFDRNQSLLWFDSFAMLPTLNLALPMVWGEDKKKIAVLKVRRWAVQSCKERHSRPSGLEEIRIGCDDPSTV